MFRKMESYLTPILLSHVDKYIKDFKSEDTQVSLWSGAVTLHNLELRQEIIQQEYNLPFTLVSGHIHELLIQVPWLKIISEPILITINTIECVLKLRDGNVADALPRARLNINKEDADSPPSYIQSLIARVVNNISFRCNNLILKYVEEDIVVSVNIKHLYLDSVNGNWEPSFTDMTLEDLHVRKLARLNDLTLCLDKRNAAGKVEKYLEPLLYRCEIEFRFDSSYKSMSAKSPLYTRININSPNLEFSISNQQVPMLMRIAALIWALKQRNMKLTYGAGKSRDAMDPSIIKLPVAVEHEGSSESDSAGNESWAGWMWSFIEPFPLGYDEKEDNTSRKRGPTVLMGIKLDNVKFSFKIPIYTMEGSGMYSGHRKVRYSTICCLQLKSYITESSTQGIQRFSFRGGVKEMNFYSENKCACGIMETQEELCGPKYIEFNTDIDSTKVSDYADHNWPLEIDEDHVVEEMTTSEMLAVCPAMAFSYVHTMQFPEDYEGSMNILDIDLENGNFKESTRIHMAIGPCNILLCAGLDHRISLIRNAAAAYDYDPYYATNDVTNPRNFPALSTDEYDALIEHIPKINMSLTAIKPKINLAVWDHPTYNGTILNDLTTMPPKRKKSSYVDPGFYYSDQLKIMPLIVFEASVIKASLIKPMYPERLMYVNSTLPEVNPDIYEACHEVYNIDVENIECFFIKKSKEKSHTAGKFVMKESKETPFVTQLTFQATAKILPQYLSDPYQLKNFDFNIDCFSGCASMPKITLAYHILNGVLNSSICETGESPLLTSTLLADAFADKEMVLFELNIEGLSIGGVFQTTTRTFKISLNSIKAFAIEPPKDTLENAKQVWIISAPDDSSASFFQAVLQVSEIEKYASFLTLYLGNLSIVMDPLLYQWLTYNYKSIQSRNCFSDDSLPGNKSESVNRQLESRKSEELLNHGASTSRSSTKRSDLEKYFVHSAPSTSENMTDTSEKDNTEAPASDTSSQGIFSIDFMAKQFVDFSNVAVHAELNMTNIYFPTKSISALNYTEASHAIYMSLLDSSDVSLDSILVIRFHKIVLKSSLLSSNLLNYCENDIPISLPLDVWTSASSSFPWEVKISSMNSYTLSTKLVQDPLKEKQDQQLQVIETNILKQVASTVTIDVTLKSKNNIKNDRNKKKDTPKATTDENPVDLDKTVGSSSMTLGVCVHMDTGSVKITVNKDQVRLIQTILHGLEELNSAILRKNDGSSTKSRKITTYQSISDELSQTTSTSKKDTLLNKNEDQKSEIENALSLSVWMQWTVSNISLNCYVPPEDQLDISTTEQSGQSNELKLVFGLEDVMGTLDADSEYIKLKLKVATGSINHYKRSFENISWAPGDFSGIILQGRETADVRDPNDPNCFFYLTMTKARCSSVHSLWKDSMRTANKGPTSTGTSDLLEVDIGLQMIDIILSPIHLLPFISAFYPALLPIACQNFNTDQITDPPDMASNVLNYLNAEAWDARKLPLLYFKCTFIRVFIPLARDGIDLSDAYTFILGIKHINLSPHAEEPMCRIPLQRDIYEKAVRSGNIYTPGNIIEDRQCQLNIMGVTIQNGLWEHIVSLVAQPISTQPAFCDTPLLGWNNIKDHLPEPLAASLLQITPQGFNLVTIIALAMFYDDMLICGPAIECTAGSTTTFEFGLSHLQNLYYMYELYSMYVRKIKISASRRSPGNSERCPYSNHMCREKNLNTTVVQELPTTSDSVLEGEGTPKKYDQNHFDAYITFNVAVINIFDDHGDVNNPVKLLSVYLNELSLMFSKRDHMSKIQVLLYALSVGLGPPTLPAEESIPLDPIIKTLLGAPDPETEIRPMFFTGCWIVNMLNKNNSLDISTKCPIEMITSLFKFKQLLELKRLIEGCLTRTISASEEEEQPIINSSEEVLQLDGNTNSLWKLLDTVGKIHLSWAPIVFKFRIEEEKWSEISMNVNAMEYTAAATSKRPERISIVALIEALSVKLSEEDVPRSRLIVNPWSFGYEINLKWEKWSIFTIPVKNCLMEADKLSVDVCYQHLKIMKRFSDYFSKHEGVLKELHQQFYGIDETTTTEKSQCLEMEPSFGPSLWDKTSSYDRYYKDDLKAGAFRSIFSTYNGKGFIQPFQMFISSTSFTWKYPQPRAITKIHSFPVPFEPILSNEENIPQEVVCHLEYYCDLRRSFHYYATFIVRQGQGVRLELDKMNENVVFSLMWRIVIWQKDDGDPDCEKSFYLDIFKFETFIKDPFRDVSVYEEKIDSALPVTPQMLFDCLKIDSFFTPKLIPTIKCLFKISGMELNLFNDHIQRHLPLLSDPLNLYKSNAATLSPYIFFNTSLSNTNIHCTMWNNTTSLMKFNSNVVCNVVEGGCLSLKDVINCDNLSGRIWKGGSADNMKGAVVKAKNFIIRGGPQNTIPLMSSVQCWLDLFQQIPKEDVLERRNNSQMCVECVNAKPDSIIQKYVICNDTTAILQIRQLMTSESINIGSRETHLYSWRAMKLARLMEVSIPSSDCISTEFKMDEVGMSTIELSSQESDKKVTLVVLVETMSPVQLSITLMGRLIIMNSLPQALDLKILENKDSKDLGKKYQIEKDMRSPSLFVDVLPEMMFRIRMIKSSSGWSGRIPLKECKSAQLAWMVKVPTDAKFVSVWCRVLTDNKFGRTLIVISPLYCIRSHLPVNTQIEVQTAEFESVTQYYIPGKGSSQALECPGTSKTHHKLIFANTNAERIQEEEMPLHCGLVNLSANSDKDIGTIESILKDIAISKLTGGADDWPYIYSDDIQWIPSDHQLATETTIRYLRPIVSVATITVDLAPWAILGNCVGLPISLHDSSSQRLSVLKHQTVMTPPSAMEKEPFFFGVQSGTDYCLSGPLSISTDELGHYESIPKGHIQINKYTTIPINCRDSVSILSISYDMKEHINILRLSSKYICTNHTDYDLLVLPLAIPLNSTEILKTPGSIEKKGIEISSKYKGNLGMPITSFCKSLGVTNMDDDGTWALFIQLSLAAEEHSFSCPIRVDNMLPRTARVIKTGDTTIPIVVTHQESHGQIYITLHIDPYPEFFIENNSNMPIAVGQVRGPPSNGNEEYIATSKPFISPIIANECSHSDWQCVLEPGTSSHYTLPSQSEKYPNVDMAPGEVETSRLAFSFVNGFPYVWSAPVSVNVNTAGAVQELPINLPGYEGKIKIKFVSHCHSIIVTVDNITEDDISASDIRSRLIGNISPMSASQDEDDDKKALEIIETSNVLCLHKDVVSKLDQPQSNFKFTILLDYLNVILTTENNIDDTLPTDVICLTGDDIVFTSTPNNMGNTNILTAGNLQIDNPLYPFGGSYDFGVILISQTKYERQCNEIERLYNFGIINIGNIVNTLRSNCLFTCRAEVEIWIHRSITNYGLSTLHISSRPVSAYFEDIYMSKLLEYATDFIVTYPNDICPHSNVIPKANEESIIVPSLVSVPEHIVYESYATARPIRFRRLYLNDLNIILSVHTSVIFYIAVDHSPLQFASFDRLNVSTSSYQLGRALMMHYLAEIIFGFGWVVGSLEMFGSPAGLVRRVSTGLRDLVREPCRGLMRGPWGFLVGMSYGSGSLLRHVALGTLESLGMVMGSVARNLDRLSLDEEHIKRTERARRHRPDGLAQALNRGLRGLGLSLLGGFGGIARGAIVAGYDSGGNPLAVAAGFSRGLLGAVTKPLSATADFLAFTGQGLIKQAGWDPRPKPRWYHSQYSDHSACALNQSWRLLLGESTIVHICHGEFMSTETPIVIMITDQILAFANPSQTTIIQKYDIELCNMMKSNFLNGEICIGISKPARSASPKEYSPQVSMSPACRARVAAYLGIEGEDTSPFETIIRLKLSYNLVHQCATVLIKVLSQRHYGNQFL